MSFARLALACAASLLWLANAARQTEHTGLAADADEHASRRACMHPEEVASDLNAKFRDGKLLVHMKRDFDNPHQTLQRWQTKGHLDYSLSYSLITPQMALEKLWVKTGYLIDASQCNALAGCKADLWVNNMVQHGSQDILTTPSGRRAELLRLIWLRYKYPEVVGMHAVFPSGFEAWATDPDSWTQSERNVFTANNDVVLHPFEEIPSAAEVRKMFAELRDGSFSVTTASGMASLSGMVARDYNTMGSDGLRAKFSEVLAMCKLSALAGFVYSLQDVDPERREATAELFRSKGAEVLQAIRTELPELAHKPLVLAEYVPTSEDGMGGKLDYPSTREEAMAAMQQHAPVKWKAEFEAKLGLTVHVPSDAQSDC